MRIRLETIKTKLKNVKIRLKVCNQGLEIWDFRAQSLKKWESSLKNKIQIHKKKTQ